MTSKHYWKISFTHCAGAFPKTTKRRHTYGSEFFDGGMATIQAARMALTLEHANDILIRAYKGVPGSGGDEWVEWEVNGA